MTSGIEAPRADHSIKARGCRGTDRWAYQPRTRPSRTATESREGRGLWAGSWERRAPDFLYPGPGCSLNAKSFTDLSVRVRKHASLLFAIAADINHQRGRPWCEWGLAKSGTPMGKLHARGRAA